MSAFFQYLPVLSRCGIPVNNMLHCSSESNRSQAEIGQKRYALNMYDYEITATDAAILLKEGKARLIDVREPWEYQTAHIEGSILMPMGDVPARAHQELDPDDRLLILCHHGARSLSVTNWLRQQGFEASQSIAGGIDAWSSRVDSFIPRY